jgi:hypothetical protein
LTFVRSLRKLRMRNEIVSRHTTSGFTQHQPAVVTVPT